MRPDERMTIGVVARRSGVPVRTLRFYEELGLIKPLGRTAKGYRLYDAAALEDLAFVKGAKRLGLQLKQISDLLRIRREGECSCGHTRRFVEARLEQVEQALGELRSLRSGMRRTLRAWDEGGGKGAQRPCRSIVSERGA